MDTYIRSLTRVKNVGYALCLTLAVAATGCQVQIGGQTLPSPWYLDDDVEYFPAGPEMPLSREASTQQELRAEAERLR